MFYGAAARVWFQIQGGFGRVGEVTIEWQRVARGGDGVALVLEHCADEGGFHGVEEVHVLLVRPERRRFARRHLRHRGGWRNRCCGGARSFFGDS